ncbi:MAG: hypothetical protein KatS3mg104_2521 [Phycisphaerae bacterium]|jgi:hypothetical protein|nr:MAG: hypothetical protein KatS3mg104_2521 [Phycisphaerae bacterium]
MSVTFDDIFRRVGLPEIIVSRARVRKGKSVDQPDGVDAGIAYIDRLVKRFIDILSKTGLGVAKDLRRVCCNDVCWLDQAIPSLNTVDYRSPDGMTKGQKTPAVPQNVISLSTPWLFQSLSSNVPLIPYQP